MNFRAIGDPFRRHWPVHIGKYSANFHAPFYQYAGPANWPNARRVMFSKDEELSQFSSG